MNVNCTENIKTIKIGNTNYESITINLINSDKKTHDAAIKNFDLKEIDPLKIKIESFWRTKLFDLYASFINNKWILKILSVFDINVKKLKAVKDGGKDKQVKPFIESSKGQSKIYGGETWHDYSISLSAVDTNKTEKTKVVFLKKLDSLEIAKNIQEDVGQEQVCLLNFANSLHPGGAFTIGRKGSQEEDIFYRSYVYYVLSPKHNTNLKEKLKYYPETHRHIPYLGVVYTPGVPLVEDAKIKVNIISAAAIDKRGKSLEYTYYKKEFKKDYKNAMQATLKMKIRMIFASAISNNHTHIVLGAFGCGAFKNEREVVAQCFKDVLNEAKFKKAFKKVYFPVENLENNSFVSKFGSGAL